MYISYMYPVTPNNLISLFVNAYWFQSLCEENIQIVKAVILSSIDVPFLLASFYNHVNLKTFSHLRIESMPFNSKTLMRLNRKHIIRQIFKKKLIRKELHSFARSLMIKKVIVWSWTLDRNPWYMDYVQFKNYAYTHYLLIHLNTFYSL